MSNILPPWLSESLIRLNQTRLDYQTRLQTFIEPFFERMMTWLQVHLATRWSESELRRLSIHLLLLLLTSGVAHLTLTLLPPVHFLESRLYDLRLYFQSAQQPRKDLLLLQITQADGQELIDTLNKIKPTTFKVIGLDTPRLFAQPQNAALRKLSKRLPLVLSSQVDWEAGKMRRIHRHPASASAFNEGFAFYPPDLDGTIRSQPLLLRYRASANEARQIPSFALVLHNQLRPQQNLSGAERYLAYPGPRHEYPTLSLKDFQHLSEQERKDKILLVTDQPLPLKARTPFHVAPSQIELHAYALAGLLDGKAYTRPQFLNALMPVLLPLLGLGVLLLTLRWGLLKALGCLSLLLIAYVIFNALIFRAMAVWLDLIIPVFATLAGTSAVMLHFHRTEGQNLRELFSTYRRHLPDQVVRTLMEQQGDGLTQNERRIVTVMFTDIQGFSRMGEKLPPDQIIQILNEYFAAMTDIVFANKGSLDKYIGDGLMAVYGNIGSNNPRQDAHYAVKTALEMQDKMAELQKKWMKEGIRPIQIRIGINTGEALVAHVGHPRRKEVTVIGDTVNTAARIEKLNKQYHTHILISHSTYEYVKDRSEVRPLGEEQLAGKSSSVMVYELKGWKAQSLV